MQHIIEPPCQEAEDGKDHNEHTARPILGCQQRMNYLVFFGQTTDLYLLQEPRCDAHKIARCVRKEPSTHVPIDEMDKEEFSRDEGKRNDRIEQARQPNIGLNHHQIFVPDIEDDQECCYCKQPCHRIKSCIGRFDTSDQC